MAKLIIPFQNRIALAFDFDETLAPPTLPRVLEYCGYYRDEFKKTHVDPLMKKLTWNRQLTGVYELLKALKLVRRSMESLCSRTLFQHRLDKQRSIKCFRSCLCRIACVE